MRRTLHDVHVLRSRGVEYTPSRSLLATRRVERLIDFVCVHEIAGDVFARAKTPHVPRTI